MAKLTIKEKKKFHYLVPLVVLLISTFFFYFFAIKVKPNDKILTTFDGVALFANENPTFEVQFGDKEHPDKQWIRFETKSSNNELFLLKEKNNIFTKIVNVFTPEKKLGIEMSLKGVDFSETENVLNAESYEDIQKVADILGTEEIKTSTVLAEMGREIGKNDDNQIISKQTIINRGIAEGIDLEYQILKGLGLKEEIVINDLEAYRNNCNQGCKLPLNEFVFDLEVDDGVVLERGWFTVEGKSSDVYYFVDKNGKYLAHFLPSYAIDDDGEKTYEVNLNVEKITEKSYEIKITVDSNWLLDENRVYPIRIDPSIVHDESADFSDGVFDRSESVAGPKIQTLSSYYWSEYISSVLDLGSSMSGITMSWLSSGVNTGNGETPYSTTGMVAQWNFNETNGTTAVSEGTCGASCNGTLANMITTGQDAGLMTGWTANNRRWGTGALMFDGVNDYVIVSNNANLSFTTGITIEAWVNPLKYNSSGYNHIIYKDNSYCLTIYNGKLGFFLNGAGGWWYPDISTIDLNKWSYVVATYNGTTKAIYINGVEVAEAPQTGSIASDTHNLSIGSGQDGAFLFNGIIDATRLYSRGLSAPEILSNYNVGNIEFQYRASADNGTWSDWTSYNDGALMFDGVDEYVTISDNEYLNFASAITIEVWVNFNNVTTAHPIIAGKSDVLATGVNYALGTQANQLSFYYFANGTDHVYTTSDASLVPNAWYHIVATFDGSSVKIYQNGTLLSGSCTNGTCNVPMVVNNNNLEIGRVGNTYFEGIMDSVRIYSRVLSLSEIFANYSTVDSEFIVSSTDLVGYWNFNEVGGITAESRGICDIACNGTLANFSNTTERDATINSGWTAKTKRGSDYPEYSFDNQCLYKTDDVGLVAYWPMDEDGESGAYISDKVGLNDGTPIGTTYVSGKYGGARSFNNSTDIISISPISLLGTDYTIETWFQYPLISTASYNTLIGGDSDHQVIVQRPSMLLGMYDGVGGTGFVSSGFVMSTLNNGWHHLAAVGTGNATNFYIDGKMVGSSNKQSTSTIAYIGNNQDGSQQFGTVDEFRIFNTALTTSKIASDYNEGIVEKSNTISQNNSSLKMDGTGSTKLTSGSYVGDSNTVGLWHLEESDGFNAYIKDSSPTPHNGTPYYTIYVNGKSGGARSFNGSSSYIGIESFGFDYNYITIEVWVKPTNLRMRNTVVDMGSDTELVPQLEIGPCNGGINAVCVVTTDVWQAQTANDVISENNWNHIVYTKNGIGATHKIYVNGVEQTLTTNASANYDSVSVSKNIGRKGSAQYFNGIIDEIAVSNIAKTANEIEESYKLGKDSYINQVLNPIDLSTKNTMAINIASDKPGTYLSAIWGESAFANYQPDANTLGLWHMDEISGSGAYIKDVSGYGNNGTPMGTTYVDGKSGGARGFNGSSDSINVGSSPSLLNLTTAVTVEAWVKRGASATEGHILGTYGTSDYGYNLSFGLGDTNNDRICFTIQGVADHCTTETFPDTTQWHYIAATYDKSFVYIFYDGQPIERFAQTATMTVANGSFSIGKRAGAGVAPFYGAIDEVRVSNTARAADQIRQVYEVGLRTYNITVTFGASLTGSNLITGAEDHSFNIDATKYGLPTLGSELFAGDKVLIKENYDGIEYIAQGTVSTVNDNTGAVTIFAWDSGSTFPSAGYTVNADVFKWQTEYILVKNRTISNQVDATNLLTFRINDGNEGRNIWIDNLRSSTGYLKTSSGEAIAFSSATRYIQYKVIFTSYDNDVTPFLSQVQVDYQSEEPTMNQIMRHGQWFDSSGTRKSFWWVK